MKTRNIQVKRKKLTTALVFICSLFLLASCGKTVRSKAVKKSSSSTSLSTNENENGNGNGIISSDPLVQAIDSGILRCRDGRPHSAAITFQVSNAYGTAETFNRVNSSAVTLAANTYAAKSQLNDVILYQPQGSTIKMSLYICQDTALNISLNFNTIQLYNKALGNSPQCQMPQMMVDIVFPGIQTVNQNGQPISLSQTFFPLDMSVNPSTGQLSPITPISIPGICGQ